MARSLLPLSSPRLSPSGSSPASPPLRGPRCVSARPLPRQRRRFAVVRAGGPPSTNALILAFVLPLSLLVGTLFAAVRVDDSLDELFLEEMAMNQAIMEENEAAMEEDDDDGEDDEEGEKEVAPMVEKEEVFASAPRIRNRPKREV